MSRKWDVIRNFLPPFILAFLPVARASHTVPESPSYVWHWFLSFFLLVVFIFLCFGVGWYNGPLRRRSYWVRNPDGTMFGVAETGPFSGSSARPSARGPAKRKQSQAVQEDGWNTDISGIVRNV